MCIRVHECHQRIIAGHSQPGFSATHTLTFTTAAVAVAGLCKSTLPKLNSAFTRGGGGGGGGLPTMTERRGLQCDRSRNCLEI